MFSEKHKLICITPVFEDQEASQKLFKELHKQFGKDVAVIAVDDGSVKQPLSEKNLLDASLDGVVLKLKRNVGHQRAIAIGIRYASEHIHDHQNIVVMDSDGEDLPETIPVLLAHLDNQAVDVVVAQRKSRVETLKFKAFYIIYKMFFKLMTGRPISFGNFMAMKAHSVRRLAVMQELPIHTAGTVLASKLRTLICPINRGPRYAGQSKMNFVGLVLHGFKALMVFAEDVLVRVGIASAVIAATAVTGITVAVFLKFLGLSTPGWFSIALGVLVLIFLQTGTLALISLLLTGMMRSSVVSPSESYQEYVASIEISQTSESD